jgi:hypothetical protein
VRVSSDTTGKIDVGTEDLDKVMTHQALNLPTGQFEIPLVIQDRRFNPDGSFRYPATREDHVLGDKVVVNGKVWP